MVRRTLLEKTPEVVEGFRMRGIEVSRTEAFADGVFGFGLTLLGVVSLQVPSTYEEVLSALKGFVPFGLCFAIFYGIWSRHYTYCRRYGLEDLRVRILTACMLFVVLAYLYPLRFVATLFVEQVLGLDTGAIKAQISTMEQFRQLFVIYGIGFASIQFIFYMLYLHAYKVREKLCLDELEALDTRWWMYEQALYMLVPLVSIVTALLAPPQFASFAGWAYFFMGFVGWFHGAQHGKRHRVVVEKMEAQGLLDEVNLTNEDELVEIDPT
jgi:uncharacterized membrane protein